MTAELPWTSVRVATGYRGNPRVSTASATAHGLFTTNIAVVATARAAVFSVANSVVSTMETHGSSRQLPPQFSRKLRWKRPRPPAAIATATRQSPRTSAEIVAADVQPKRFPRPSETARGHCHGNPPIRGEHHGISRNSAAIATARAAILSVTNSVVPTMPTAVRGNCHGSFHGTCRGTEEWVRVRVGSPPIRDDYHGISRISAVIATARAAILSVTNSVVPTVPKAVRGNCEGSFRGNCRGAEVWVRVTVSSMALKNTTIKTPSAAIHII